MMSDLRGTNTRMDERLEHLTDLAGEDSTIGRLELLDACSNYAVGLCYRPGDVDRVAATLYELTTELAYARRVNAA